MNAAKIRALGVDPYGERTRGVVALSDAIARYDAQADQAANANAKTPGFVDPRPLVKVAGRVMLLRDNGKLLWLNLRDATGDMQVAISQRDVPEKDFAVMKCADLGDVVVVEGRVMKTKSGEVTVWASSASVAAKSLVPPPEKHAGLSDVEIRYRQRYVDLWANPETLRVFEARSAIVARIREFMRSRGYVEVETPMLQSLAGGAAARPFITKMNALSINLYMRIAPELYLKRLLVGGMPRVFEINRNFRNEGLDKQHNPEFTMLEAYEAFGDMDTVMELTESLIRDAASSLPLPAGGSGGVGSLGARSSATAIAHTSAHTTSRTHPPTSSRGEGEQVVLPFGDLSINYSRPFERVTYAALFEKAYGFPMSDHARARAELTKRMPAKKEAIAAMDIGLVINELFEDKERGGEAQLDPSRPTFITHYPAAISPLTRPSRTDPSIADRADLFIAGMEIAPHYTELNDPDVQEARFREQLTGLDADKNAEEQTYRTLDHDFLRALKVGMPPAGGMGLGIDRLVMLLTNQRTIRDVVLFPLMRPE